MSFSKVEIRDLVICWLALGVCFSLQYLIPVRNVPYSSSIQQFAFYFAVSLIGIGAGFVFHEIAHKGVARHFGYQAEFRMWKLGLLIAVASAVLSFGRFLFFAPGAVYTSTGQYPDLKKEGLISMAGPAANIALAVLFYILTFYSGVTGIIGSFGVQVNLWLAAFNLIPFPPLDGVKILRWSRTVWTILAAVSWGLLLLIMFGVIKI